MIKSSATPDEVMQVAEFFKKLSVEVKSKMATTKKKAAPAADHKALSLGETKLKSSGLTLEDAKLLSMHCLSQQQTAAQHQAFKQLCSLRIDYLGPDGRPISDWPGSKPFYRVRYLETPTDFASMTDKKPVRLADGSQGRFYAIRNVDYWLTATGPLVIEHLNKWDKKQSGQKAANY